MRTGPVVCACGGGEDELEAGEVEAVRVKEVSREEKRIDGHSG